MDQVSNFLSGKLTMIGLPLLEVDAKDSARFGLRCSAEQWAALPPFLIQGLCSTVRSGLSPFTELNSPQQGGWLA